MSWLRVPHIVWSSAVYQPHQAALLRITVACLSDNRKAVYKTPSCIQRLLAGRKLSNRKATQGLEQRPERPTIHPRHLSTVSCTSLSTEKKTTTHCYAFKKTINVSFSSLTNPDFSSSNKFSTKFFWKPNCAARVPTLPNFRTWRFSLLG